MEKEDYYGIAGWVLIIVVASSTAIFALNWGGEVTLKREAIERNFAEYNSKTGVWQWKTNN